jgi:uncharacterized OB-fold protein
MVEEVAQRPLLAAPRPDRESQSYWDGLRAHRVLLQRCGECARLRFPPMPSCPYCGATTHEEVEVDAAGTVYSFVRVHVALTPAMRDQVPYVVATVQLDCGPRMYARIQSGADEVAVDDRVRPRFLDHDDWTELRFDRVAAAAAQPR